MLGFSQLGVPLGLARSGFLSFMVAVVLATESPSCSSDMDCANAGSAWRCCGATLKGENCPPTWSRRPRSAPSLSAAGEGGCILPGTIGATECVCTPVPLSMCGGNPPPAVPGKKQWLMIGDSISYGCLGPATDQAAAVNIQVTHNPTNAANVWWGSHCLETWLGPDPSRWDAVSFNFGLHDLALDNERIEPANYTRELANITSRIASALPKVKLLWVTTTPVPLGIDGACNKTTGQGGCPPRRATDPPVFNSAAARAIQASGHADRVTVLDLYSTVTKRCGTNYELCPENCTASHVNGKWEGNCFQIPHNVHYLPAAWEVLATAYVNAVKALIG